MREGIPDDIISEIAPLGGIGGISRGMPPKEILDTIAKSHEILSEPIRLRILLALGRGKLCVCVLKKITSCPDTRLSYHLSALKRCGLVAAKRDRSFLKYYLTSQGKTITREVLKNIKHFES